MRRFCRLTTFIGIQQRKRIRLNLTLTSKAKKIICTCPHRWTPPCLREGCRRSLRRSYSWTPTSDTSFALYAPSADPPSHNLHQGGFTLGADTYRVCSNRRGERFSSVQNAAARAKGFCRRSGEDCTHFCDNLYSMDASCKDWTGPITAGILHTSKLSFSFFRPCISQEK